MNKNILSSIAAVLTALALSFVLNDDSLDNLKFHTGLYNTAEEEKVIEMTLKQFNKHFATLFNTGGDLQSLNYIPAENLVKRRIVQEINEWSSNNEVLVYDRDVFEIEDIEFYSPERAVVTAEEVWFLNVQNREKRYKKSGVKASPIRVRYILVKHDDRWKVSEFEVYGKDDPVPPLRREGVWS
jgi:hypothetical protein